MAMQYGFFDAVESNGSYDRVYGAAFFTHFINAYFCSAVPDGCFTVTKNSGLTLNVGSGHGIVGGVYFYDDSASTLSVTPATGTRNDLVVARLNAAARTVTLEVKPETMYVRHYYIPDGSETAVWGNWYAYTGTALSQ